MLVLGRKVNESIRIEGPCTITLLRANNGHARVGIEADKTIPIIRTEVLERKRKQGKAIAASGSTAEQLRSTPGRTANDSPVDV